MKKQITILGMAVILVIAIAITALAQKGKEDKEKKDKGNKEQKDNGRNDKKEKNDKGGKHDEDKNKDNRGNNDGRNDNDKQGDKGGSNAKVKDYKWDNDNFKDRGKIRKNMGKVTICHKPGRDNDGGVTLSVSANALKAHLGHGDIEGECPAVTGNRFSETYLERRNDYYNILQNSQEQVIYSRSILDYALERLTGVRSQLVVLERNNAPAADLERKRLVVTELERDVSLLERLVGITANLVAAKLMD